MEEHYRSTHRDRALRYSGIMLSTLDAAEPGCSHRDRPRTADHHNTTEVPDRDAGWWHLAPRGVGIENGEVVHA